MGGAEEAGGGGHVGGGEEEIEARKRPRASGGALYRASGRKGTLAILQAEGIGLESPTRNPLTSDMVDGCCSARAVRHFVSPLAPAPRRRPPTSLNDHRHRHPSAGRQPHAGRRGSRCYLCDVARVRLVQERTRRRPSLPLCLPSRENLVLLRCAGPDPVVSHRKRPRTGPDAVSSTRLFPPTQLPRATGPSHASIPQPISTSRPFRRTPRPTSPARFSWPTRRRRDGPRPHSANEEWS